MLMQNFGVTNKEHYGMLWYFWSGQLNEEHFTFQLQYKHSGTFANLKSYPPKSENVRPHSGNPIETGTPSSGTPQLASYKEARENELRERIPVPRDNFFKIYLKSARVLRRLFLSIVSVTRAVNFHPLPALLLTPFFARSLTLVPCSLLLNRTETLPTQANFEPIFSFRVHGWIQTTVSQLAGVSGCRRKRLLSFFAIGCWLFI